MAIKILTVIGARPQFIKACPFSMAVSQNNQISECVVHTGQHYDPAMSDVFFYELGIRAPDYNLGIGSGTHGCQTGRMIEKIEEIISVEKPDLTVVFGDTNSTVAGAVASAKLDIPVAHIEAGMRNGEQHMPEEINRKVTDRISSLFFCPTRTAVDNLKKEGIQENVHLVGDIMVDSFFMFNEIARKKSSVIEKFDLAGKKFAVLTVHRAENTGDRTKLLNILKGCSESGLTTLFPVHPGTKKVIESGIDVPKGIIMCDPVSYLDMLALLNSAEIVVTDSGGIQKEAYLAGTPCLTARNSTEWPETVEYGWNKLVGFDAEQIRNSMREIKHPEHRPDFLGKSGLTFEIVGIINICIENMKADRLIKRAFCK
ncbi:MAG TPA: UDP-N-acetylglucosamine 2-epimerase (non-hydrolyzing) [bacterium]|nr:UDP-N-acetylglucosamine 2-epimerase (non-hydrolyzing) [bacterium]